MNLIYISQVDISNQVIVVLFFLLKVILTPRHEFAFPRCRSLFTKIDFICIYLVSLYEVNKNI